MKIALFPILSSLFFVQSTSFRVLKPASSFGIGYRMLSSQLHAEASASNEACEGRFNKKIDLDSEKVVNTIELASGGKAVLCRCWKSAKFPLCDGAHAQHNKETGDNLGPVIVTVKKE